MTERIQTSNYTRITRAYLTQIVEPALAGKSVLASHRYDVATLKLELASYNTRLAELFSRALAHLPSFDEGPELTVFLWDNVHSAISMEPPWSNPHYHSLATNARHTSDEDGFIGIYMHYDDTMTLYDPATRRAYFWIHDASRVPVWVSAAPLRTLLQWALGGKDIHLIHGAVVAINNNAVLLTAKGGSGKSTTALACVEAGMQYLADDYVAVSRANTPSAFSLYNSIKVAPLDGQGFDAAHVSFEEGEKSIVYLSALFPNQMTSSATLRAIMIPEITNRSETVISKTTGAQAMLALLPTTLFQLPLAESTKMKQLASIIAAVPCYTLELGRDPKEAAGEIKAHLQGLL